METHTRAEAIRLGLKRYFTGKPCKHGHIAARKMIGGCIECHKIDERKRKPGQKRRRYWRADEVAAREAARLKREQDRAARAAERVAAKQAAKIEAERVRQERIARNAAMAAEKRRTYYVANRVRILDRARAYRARNPEKHRERSRRWKRSEKGREYRRNRKRFKKKRLTQELMTLQRGRCAYCRTKLDASNTHVDHIQPLARGGPNARPNYQLACFDCNVAKGAKDPIEFSQERGMLL